MKKHLLILPALALVFASYVSHAQLINPGFETWSADALVPSAMNPNTGNASTGWWTYNMFNYSVLGSSPVSVFRCDTTHSGTYSARIKTVIYTPTSNSYNAPWGLPFIGHNYLDTLGILFNGTTNETSASYKPGIPFTQKIATLSFWYQYAPQAGDTAECRALLVTNRVAQGGGLIKITNVTGPTWQQATITFAYVNSLTPDTLYILFSSSSLDHKPKPGSVLLVDDVSVTLLTGINETQALNDITVFPNPTNGVFQITNDKLRMTNVEVYNVMGEKVYDSTMNSNKSQIDLSNQPSGIYFLQLKTEQGTANKKIVICH